MRFIRHCIVAASVAASLPACAFDPNQAVEPGDTGPIGTESEALGLSSLTRTQAKTVLGLVDSVCGDTWCDGDYDFGFRRIVCSRAAGTCTLTLQLFPREGVAAAQPVYFRSCKTAGFTGFDSLVSTAPNGYQSLADGYYDALTECIFRLEQNL